MSSTSPEDLLSMAFGRIVDFRDFLHKSANSIYINGLSCSVLTADVGAGTGLLTKTLIDMIYSVIAIEPNDEMRQAFAKLLSGSPTYQSIQGSAETIPLRDSSVDMITVAQACHWFDISKVKLEFRWMLRANWVVAIIWNDRVLNDRLHIAQDEKFGQ